MRAGLLKDVITIHKPKYTTNVLGETEEEYEPTWVTRAEVRNIAHDMTQDNDEQYYSVRKQITLRRYVPVDDYDKIEYNKELYSITSIDRDRERIIIYASKD